MKTVRSIRTRTGLAASWSHLYSGGLLMFGILLGDSMLMESVSEEKETRMIEVLLTSVSPLAVMVGKVLALGAIGLIQIAVWVASVAIIGPHIIDQIPDAGQLAIEPGILASVIGVFLTGYLVFCRDDGRYWRSNDVYQRSVHRSP